MIKILAVLLTACTVVTYGQNPNDIKIVTSQIEVEDSLRPSISISFNADDDDVEALLNKEIKELRGKADHKHGLIVGKQLVIPDITPLQLEAYYKVESKGRKAKEVSTVFLSLKRTDGSYVSDSTDSEAWMKAQTYLASLPAKVSIYHKDEELLALRKQLADVTEELKDLQSNSSDQRKNYKRKSKQIDALSKRIDALEKGN